MKKFAAKFGLLAMVLTVAYALPTQSGLSTSFSCYCNGKYVGEMDDIWACWSACPDPQ